MVDTAIVWLHRDLRLHDNPALTTALLTARRVVIAYIWAPREEGQFQPGRVSRWWLYQSLKWLDAQIQGKGNRICYRKGDSVIEELLKLCAETGARLVLFNNVYDPISIVRDHTVKQQLHAAGVVSRSFNAELLYEPWDILDGNMQPHTSFEEFWDTVCNRMPVPVAPARCVEPTVIPGINMPALYHTSLQDLNLETQEELHCNVHLSYRWSPGTAGALRLFAKFLEKGLESFDKDRAKTDRDSTSKLSPHIHFGEISVRLIYHEVKAREAALKAADPGSTAVDDFLRQLGYHEYSRYLSFHFPFTHERSLLEHVRAVPWVYCAMRFKAWRQGNTGVPIVDAAMRELWATGWMHNRSRVVVASFLVKNLLQPWQWGLKHFWDMLLDADLECDALGWQYVAGCLKDAHPFNYMLDLPAESKRFDPTGNYVRRWVPQLSKVPTEWLHTPWLAPKSVLHSAGVTLGEDYPHPIISFDESRAAVDHAWGVIQRCQMSAIEDAPYNNPTCPVAMEVLEPEDEVDSVPKAKGQRAPQAARSALSHMPHYTAAGGVTVQGYSPDVVLPDISRLVDHAATAFAAMSGTGSKASTGPDLLQLARQRVGSSTCSAYAPCDRSGDRSSGACSLYAMSASHTSGGAEDADERGTDAVEATHVSEGTPPRRRHRVRLAPVASTPAASTSEGDTLPSARQVGRAAESCKGAEAEPDGKRCERFDCDRGATSGNGESRQQKGSGTAGASNPTSDATNHVFAASRGSPSPSGTQASELQSLHACQQPNGDALDWSQRGCTDCGGGGERRERRVGGAPATAFKKFSSDGDQRARMSACQDADFSSRAR